MDLISYSSSVGRQTAHVSYKIKYCHKVFDRHPEVQERCEEIFREVAEAKAITILEIGFDGDHVHMAILFPPKYALVQISKWFKKPDAKLCQRAEGKL